MKTKAAIFYCLIYMDNTLVKQLIILSLFLTVTSALFAQKSDTAKFRFKTIVIDAGHGGKDPGAAGKYSTEKSVTLAIAKRLRRALAEDMPSLNIIMTRSDDTFIGLSKRSDIANDAHANLFLSIHCNSSPVGTGWQNRGAEILVYAIKRSKEQFEATRENASILLEKNYKSKYASYDESNPANLMILNMLMQKSRKQSIIFGDLISKEVKSNEKRRSMGVKEQSVLVLAHAGMPAVLFETGYINNEDDENYLNSEDGQDAIVQSIVRALKTYKKQMAQ